MENESRRKGGGQPGEIRFEDSVQNSLMKRPKGEGTPGKFEGRS